MSQLTMFDKTVFLIPAREGSKGFPHKNRKLFMQTLRTMPEELKSKIYVSTDDPAIKVMATNEGVDVVHRPIELATDEASLKSVMQHFLKEKNIPDDYNVILLFLTYPERTWQDIVEIYSEFLKNTNSSLICCEETSDHPYLCFKFDEEKSLGRLVVEHDLYRRQDYPKCVRQSMFFACYKAWVIQDLHDLLFEDNTLFFKLDEKKIDIDYEIDYNIINTIKE